MWPERGVMMRPVRILKGAAAAGVLAGASYALTTWYRYGRVSGTGPPDPMLDRFLPEYEVRERHEIRVSAPAAATFAAARALELNRSPVIRAIFRARELLMGASATPSSPAPRPFLDEVVELGWRILAEEPGREIVLGAVTQPWQADVVFRGMPVEAFRVFDEPGYVKIAWTLCVEPVGEGASVFRTETRVMATEPESRARFRRYWVLVAAGIRMIRLETLRLVKRSAEASLTG